FLPGPDRPQLAIRRDRAEGHDEREPRRTVSHALLDRTVEADAGAAHLPVVVPISLPCPERLRENHGVHVGRRRDEERHERENSTGRAEHLDLRRRVIHTPCRGRLMRLAGDGSDSRRETRPGRARNPRARAPCNARTHWLISFSARTPERMPPSQSAMLIEAAAAKPPAIAAAARGGTGRRVTRYHRIADEGHPTSAMSPIVKRTAAIMNATPPYEPATWLGLSALKRGYRAPSPIASPTIASDMKSTVTAATPRRNGSMPRNWFAATVSPSVSRNTGSRPIQNLDQRKARSDTGAVRMIQNACPSADTAGNTKRAQTVDMTSPAIARFTNA